MLRVFIHRKQCKNSRFEGKNTFTRIACGFLDENFPYGGGDRIKQQDIPIIKPIGKVNLRSIQTPLFNIYFTNTQRL
jgi:hypothetical protein